MSLVYLIGMPGCGKTTVGKQLADALNFSFIDLDALIEQKSGENIRFLFEHHGETSFRAIERDCLLQTTNLKNTVVSCGGGTPAFYDNIKIMNRAGLTIYLDAPLNLLSERLQHSKTFRPLLQSYNSHDLLSKLEKIYESRLPYYRLAHLKVKIPIKNVKTLARSLIQRIISAH